MKAFKSVRHEARMTVSWAERLLIERASAWTRLRVMCGRDRIHDQQDALVGLRAWITEKFV